MGYEQKCKVLTNDETKIITTDKKRFKNTINMLEENKFRYCRPQLKSEKPFQVVLQRIITTRFK